MNMGMAIFREDSRCEHGSGLFRIDACGCLPTCCVRVCGRQTWDSTLNSNVMLKSAGAGSWPADPCKAVLFDVCPVGNLSNQHHYMIPFKPFHIQSTLTYPKHNTDN